MTAPRAGSPPSRPGEEEEYNVVAEGSWQQVVVRFVPVIIIKKKKKKVLSSFCVRMAEREDTVDQQHSAQYTEKNSVRSCKKKSVCVF